MRRTDARAGTLAAEVGGAIRAARRRVGLTIAEAATRAGVTQPFLSQVENGKTMPSLLTLHRIADALGVSAQVLVSEDAGAVTILRHGEGRQYQRSDIVGSVLERLLTQGRRLMQPGEIWAAADSDSGEFVSHAGEEFLYVLEGRLQVVLEHLSEEILGVGDCLYYPATVPHRWIVVGKRACRFLVIATPASF